MTLTSRNQINRHWDYLGKLETYLQTLINFSNIHQEINSDFSLYKLLVLNFYFNLLYNQLNSYIREYLNFIIIE